MRGFRLGRLFGIDLRVDWSWVMIFVLMTWNLVATFSVWHPNWTSIGVFVTAVCASLLFFLCVVLHELAHSLVATAFGVRVRSITLFLFGGVSNIEREPPSALAEFLTAIVGPITSIVLGLVALGVATAATNATFFDVDSTKRAFSELGPIMTLLAWLGPINVLIGFFNLIPGFPLDGGRVLRSILWAGTHDLTRATRWAAAIGQAIGWVFIACGIAMTFGAYIPLMGTGLANGLWLAFIGWFLHGAASQASTRVALDDLLAGMTVGQIMVRGGPVAREDMSVAELVHEGLMPGDDRALPVVRGGVLVGLVSISDVRAVPPEAWSTTTVASVMRKADELAIATADEPLATAFEELARLNVEQLPVLEGGRLVGMLRRKDIARWIELSWRPGSPRHRPHEPAHHAA